MNYLLNLTRQLIAIPSYLDGKINENKVGEFIYSYLKDNLKWLKISKQNIGKGRFNIIAANSNNPQLVFISHMDTVYPARDHKEALRPKLSKNKLYGLGSADMKSGLAASIIAAQEMSKTARIAFIFDCDEEYYFEGIKKIIKKYKFKPDLVICPEPTNLKIVNGCRGVIELKLDVIGKTAHAGSPQKGINAIERSVGLVDILKRELTVEDVNELGKTTVNLSSITGGRLLDSEIITQANAVPDITKVLLDIRPANPQLTGGKIKKIIWCISKQLEIRISNFEVKLDYSPYYSKKTDLNLLEKAIKETGFKPEYKKNLGLGGFFEAAIVSRAWNCPAVSFGPIGEGHVVKENVDIESLEKTKNVFVNLIKQF